MAKFRADFDVKGSLVLPVGQAELTFRGADRNIEITLSNRRNESAEHANGLVACVVADADDIDKVVDHFRTLLARQLDLLTFVTQSGFEIDQCRRVIDWEPHQKKRRIRPLHRFDRFDPVWSKYWSETSISSIENLIALITVPVPHRRPG